MHEDGWQVIVGAAVAGVVQPMAAWLVLWLRSLVERRHTRHSTVPMHARDPHAQELASCSSDPSAAAG